MRRHVHPVEDEAVVSAEWALCAILDDLIRYVYLLPRLTGVETAMQVSKMFRGT